MNKHLIYISDLLIRSIQYKPCNPTQYLSESDCQEINLKNLQTFRAATDHIMELGESEHQSDWDPCLIIKLKSGESITGASHYPEFEIHGMKPASITIPMDDEDGAATIEKTIPISDIESIELDPQ